MIELNELEQTSGEIKPDVIVEGSTWKAIWHMSWPSLVQMLTIAIASFADVWTAGQLGSEVQAAIGIGGQIWYLMMMLAVALSAGATAIVSRHWGARELDDAIEATRNCLTFAFIFGLITAAIGLFGGRLLFSLLGASPKVQALGWQYLKFDMWSQIPFTIIWVTHSVFRAKGNARVPMLIWLLMTVMVITGDLTLCLPQFPFHFGIAGIGISWVIAAFTGCSVALYILSRSELGPSLNVKAMLQTGLSKSWIWRLLKIGLPACVQDVAWVAGNFVLFLIFALTSDPTSCQAAWAVGLRLEEMVAGLPIHALSMAIATIVGQNLGANRPERAEQAGWQVGAISAGYNALVGGIMFAFAQPIAHVMSSDPKVILFTTQYLQVIGIVQPFVAVWMTLFGAMQGAGYTKWPMWASAILLTGIRLPLAYLLTVKMGYGAIGTWMSISITSVMIGTIAVWRFRTGVWKLQKV